MTSIELFSFARQLGFTPSTVQKCGICGSVSTRLSNSLVKYCRACKNNVPGWVCQHNTTDGTIDLTDCTEPYCGVTKADLIRGAQDTIKVAIAFLDDSPCRDLEDWKARAEMAGI